MLDAAPMPPQTTPSIHHRDPAHKFLIHRGIGGLLPSSTVVVLQSGGALPTNCAINRAVYLLQIDETQKQRYVLFPPQLLQLMHRKDPARLRAVRLELVLFLRWQSISLAAGTECRSDYPDKDLTLVYDE